MHTFGCYWTRRSRTLWTLFMWRKVLPVWFTASGLQYLHSTPAFQFRPGDYWDAINTSDWFQPLDSRPRSCITTFLHTLLIEQLLLLQTFAVFLSVPYSNYVGFFFFFSSLNKDRRVNRSIPFRGLETHKLSKRWSSFRCWTMNVSRPNSDHSKTRTTVEHFNKPIKGSSEIWTHDLWHPKWESYPPSSPPDQLALSPIGF